MTTAPVPRVVYADIRGQIRSGDLLLCQGTSIFALLIQHATGSSWSHVGFVMRLDAVDRVMVCESIESWGVRTVPLTRYLINYDGKGHPYPGRLFLGRHAAFATQAASRLAQFSQAAIDLFGAAYDTQQIASIAARIVAAKIGLDPHAVQKNNTFICSEFAEVCYQSLGITIPYDRRGYIAPVDFAASPDVELLWELEVSPAC